MFPIPWTQDSPVDIRCVKIPFPEMEGNILTGTPYFLNGQQIGFVVWSVFPSKTNGFFEGGNQCHEVVDLDAESQEIGD